MKKYETRARNGRAKKDLKKRKAGKLDREEKPRPFT